MFRITQSLCPLTEDDDELGNDTAPELELEFVPESELALELEDKLVPGEDCALPGREILAVRSIRPYP
jgi:hypothetical protein